MDLIQELIDEDFTVVLTSGFGLESIIAKVIGKEEVKYMANLPALPVSLATTVPSFTAAEFPFLGP